VNAQIRRMYVFTLGVMLVIPGCATVNQRCQYDDTGRLLSYHLRSTIWGTGELELTTGDCAVMGFGTRDTGLSDNAKAAMGIVAETVVTGLVPQAGAAAFLGGLMDGQDCEDEHCD